MSRDKDILMGMFDVFKKKEPEKKGDLPDIPPLPELPKVPETGGPEIPSRLPQPPSKEAPDEQRESMLPPKPEMLDFPKPESLPKPMITQPEPALPEIPSPEPIQMPKPEPEPFEIAKESMLPKGLPGPPPLPKRTPRVKREPIEMPEITPPKRPQISTVKPHLFVKIDKYREVVDSVQKLKSELADIRKTLKDLENLDSQSIEKLKACGTITNKITELIAFFEQSFTAPE